MKLSKLLYEAREEAKKVLFDLEVTEPPIDVVKACQRRDIEVIDMDFVNNEIKGLLKRSTKRGHPVIAINRKVVGFERRFLIAKLLGHFIMHPMEILKIEEGVIPKIFLIDDVSDKAVPLDIL